MNRGVPSKAKDPKYVLRHLLKYIKRFKFSFLVVILLIIEPPLVCPSYDI